MYINSDWLLLMLQGKRLQSYVDIVAHYFQSHKFRLWLHSSVCWFDVICHSAPGLRHSQHTKTVSVQNSRNIFNQRSLFLPAARAQIKLKVTFKHASIKQKTQKQEKKKRLNCSRQRDAWSRVSFRPELCRRYRWWRCWCRELTHHIRTATTD